MNKGNRKAGYYGNYTKISTKDIRGKFSLECKVDEEGEVIFKGELEEDTPVEILLFDAVDHYERDGLEDINGEIIFERCDFKNKTFQKEVQEIVRDLLTNEIFSNFDNFDEEYHTVTITLDCGEDTAEIKGTKAGDVIEMSVNCVVDATEMCVGNLDESWNMFEDEGQVFLPCILSKVGEQWYEDLFEHTAPTEEELKELCEDYFDEVDDDLLRSANDIWYENRYEDMKANYCK